MLNQLKTVLLLGCLTALMLGVGMLVGGMSGLTIAIIIAVTINFITYFFSDKIVLAMYRAKPASEKDYPELHKIVREVSHLANLPMPKVYVLPSANPNAFATGRNPKNAAIACTSGIMELLSKTELKGVIAHEMAHIKNRDILIATIAATIAGIISYVAIMARWAAIFGGFGGRDEGGQNFLSLLVLAILAPLIALIIQLAISRSREYHADATGAKFIHNPGALADALHKLDVGIKHNPMRGGNPTTASLFILNPFSAKGIVSLFSTHPPLQERIKRLKDMG
jgi:heat shock protein HtpX